MGSVVINISCDKNESHTNQNRWLKQKVIKKTFTLHMYNSPYCTMSSTENHPPNIQSFEAEWAQFVKQSSSNETDYIQQLYLYNTFRKSFDHAYETWKRDYKTWCEMCESPATSIVHVPEGGSERPRTVEQLAQQHQTIEKRIQTALHNGSSTCDIMTLWKSYNDIHVELMHTLNPTGE